jgi:hypothetical protein
MEATIKEKTLTEALKKRGLKQTGGRVEIRFSEEEGCRDMAWALLRSFQLAGIRVAVVETPAEARRDVSIETSLDGARVGLGIQSALLEIGFTADFLVHSRVPDKVVIVHVGKNCRADV